MGRLTGMWAPNGPALSLSNGESVTLAHDAGGRLTKKTFPNGVTSRYMWNPDTTMAQLLTQLGSMVVSQHDYTYDGVGNRQTHIERIGETTTPYKYVYDPLDRLTEVRNNTTNALLVSYMYDRLGNRLNTTEGGATTYYFYNAAHQVTQYCVNDFVCTSPTHTFTYDLNGNLASRVDGTLTTTYAYDPENRLVWTGATEQPSQTYAYDDQGRRLRKVVGATAAQFLYHGADIAAEYDSTWVTPTARYTHGPRVDDPLLPIRVRS